MASKTVLIASLLVGAGMLSPIPILGPSTAMAQAATTPAMPAGPVVKTKDVTPIPVEPMEIEVITVEPSDEHVWIPGYYERNSERWDWVKGRWEKPPHKHARFHRGHWRHEGGANWRWHRGHWAVTNGVGYFVDEVIEVPAAHTEVKGTAPTKDAHWVAGYSEWDGEWHWKKGYWDKRAQKYEHLSWVPGQWHRTMLGNHRWVSGHFVERRGHG